MNKDISFKQKIINNLLMVFNVCAVLLIGVYVLFRMWLDARLMFLSEHEELVVAGSIVMILLGGLYVINNRSLFSEFTHLRRVYEVERSTGITDHGELNRLLIECTDTVEPCENETDVNATWGYIQTENLTWWNDPNDVHIFADSFNDIYIIFEGLNTTYVCRSGTCYKHLQGVE